MLDHFQTVKFSDDAPESRLQKVEFCVDTFTPLLTEKAETDAEATHRRDNVAFEKVQLWCDVPARTLHNLATSRGHEKLYLSFKFEQSFSVYSPAGGENLVAVGIKCHQLVVPLSND